MNSYSIKQVEKLSGIMAHTLRMWEKRYGLVVPQRTDANIRYYTASQLKQILNISILINKGWRISQIAAMSADELKKSVVEVSTHKGDSSDHIEGLLAAMLEFDEERFDRILSSCVLRMGLEMTISKVLHPFFRKIGLLWQTDAIHPGQEHFASQLIRSKIIAATDSPHLTASDGCAHFLLFLPEGEHHELGLLFYNYLIRKSGHKSYYLGQSLPISAAADVARFKPIDCVVSTFYGASDPAAALGFLRDLRTHFPLADIIITNRISVETDHPAVDSRMHINMGPDEFRTYLHERGKGETISVKNATVGKK